MTERCHRNAEAEESREGGYEGTVGAFSRGCHLSGFHYSGLYHSQWNGFGEGKMGEPPTEDVQKVAQEANLDFSMVGRGMFMSFKAVRRNEII